MVICATGDESSSEAAASSSPKWASSAVLVQSPVKGSAYRLPYHVGGWNSGLPLATKPPCAALSSSLAGQNVESCIDSASRYGFMHSEKVHGSTRSTMAPS